MPILELSLAVANDEINLNWSLNNNINSKNYNFIVDEFSFKVIRDLNIYFKILKSG
jgi:hypothetical protein